MGILDDAIKEHLELKRQHGADASELRQLEDEAFGAAERPGGEQAAPDPVAEAPTEFMQQPDLEQPGEPEASAAVEIEEEQPKRAPRAEIADLQEGPEPPAPPEPAEEEAPAMEHETVPEAPPEPEPVPEATPEPESPDIAASHSTEERERIGEQPTEMFDVEQEPGDADAEPSLEPDAAGEQEDDVDDDFWDDKRLSDELDQALEGPGDDLPTDDADAEEPGAASLAVEPAEEAEQDQLAEQDPEPGSEEHDALEDTPDFLEEAPEDDRLWFEQKPPKDFDFDD
ncbi:MAG: hypothetical protein WD404_01880 [Solirubrobacterales bacterium]